MRGRDQTARPTTSAYVLGRQRGASAAQLEGRPVRYVMRVVPEA